MRSASHCAALLLATSAALAPLAPASAGAAGTCAGVQTTIIGTEGDDVLHGTDRRDVISGGGGRDRIFGLGGNDLICGGQGGDRLEGGPGRDVILGEDDVDKLFGGGGNDRVFGGNAGDHVHGGYGDDELHTGRAYPPRGYPDYVFVDPGNDVLVGGHEQSIIDGAGASRGIVVDLTAGTIRGMGHDRIEDLFPTVIGSEYADRITGSDGPDLIDPNLGRDVVQGAGGNDWVVDSDPDRDLSLGGAGDDHVTATGPGSRAYGGPGNDALKPEDGAAAFGGYGNDQGLPRSTARFDGGPGVDALLLYNLRGGVRADLREGIARGRSVVRFAAIENLGGTDFADILIGDAGPNFLDGGPGNDVLRAREGDDRLQGQSGADTQYGGLGTDTCSAGTNYGCEGFEAEPLF